MGPLRRSARARPIRLWDGDSDSHLVDRVRASVHGGCRRGDPRASRRTADRRLGVAAADAAVQPRSGQPVPVRRGDGRQRRPDRGFTSRSTSMAGPRTGIWMFGVLTEGVRHFTTTSRRRGAGSGHSRTSAPVSPPSRQTRCPRTGVSRGGMSHVPSRRGRGAVRVRGAVVGEPRRPARRQSRRQPQAAASQAPTGAVRTGWDVASTATDSA